VPCKQTAAVAKATEILVGRVEVMRKMVVTELIVFLTKELEAAVLDQQAVTGFQTQPVAVVMEKCSISLVKWCITLVVVVVDIMETHPQQTLQ
jgi:hypothetical protein